MSKFKVGDEIVRVNTKASWAHIGYTATVLEGHQYLGKDFCVKRIFEHQWELVQEVAKPKWSIYNNTLPWSELSDKHKGKLLLAAHNDITISVGNIGVIFKPAFDDGDTIYNAQYIELVKPEPTMAELFEIDSESFDFRGSGDFPEYMIAKGWTKTCK